MNCTVDNRNEAYIRAGIVCLEPPLNNYTPAKCYCSICHHVWYLRRKDIKGGCPECNKKYIAEKHRLEAIEYCKTVLFNLECWGGGASKKSIWRCKCGYCWSVSFSVIKYKQTKVCPKCAGQVITEDTVSDWCKVRGFDLDMNGWGGGSTKISRFYCFKCNHKWKTTFHSIKKYNKGCPQCARLARRTPPSEVVLFCKNLTFHMCANGWGGSASHKSRFECEVCGNKWLTTFNNIKCKHSGCPFCNKKGYTYKNILFDSSWELIFYLYHLNLGSNIIRLEGLQEEHSFEYEFEGKKHLWYPDFLIDGIYYEVKPICGFHGKDIPKNNAKRLAHLEIRWIQDNEIKEMKKVVGDIRLYKII